MNEPIYVFYKVYYIPSIDKLAVDLAHVKILSTNNFCKQQREVFKRRTSKKYEKTRRDISEIFTSTF